MPLLRLGLTGRRPISIQACVVGLFRMCEGMLPMDMHSGHNFLSLEKLVRNI